MAAVTHSVNTTWPQYITVHYNPSSYSSNARNWPPRALSRKERKLQQQIEDLEGNTKKLEFRLRAAEIERRAVSDHRSRARSPHPTSRAPTTRRLQTYDAAMAARRASKWA